MYTCNFIGTWSPYIHLWIIHNKVDISFHWDKEYERNCARRFFTSGSFYRETRPGLFQYGFEVAVNKNSETTLRCWPRWVKKNFSSSPAGNRLFSPSRRYVKDGEKGFGANANSPLPLFGLFIPWKSALQRVLIGNSRMTRRNPEVRHLKH